jgi:hypothetical protein
MWHIATTDGPGQNRNSSSSCCCCCCCCLHQVTSGCLLCQRLSILWLAPTVPGHAWGPSQTAASATAAETEAVGQSLSVSLLLGPVTVDIMSLAVLPSPPHHTPQSLRRKRGALVVHSFTNTHPCRTRLPVDVEVKRDPQRYCNAPMQSVCFPASPILGAVTASLMLSASLPVLPNVLTLVGLDT